jgi:hypothetical protein
MTKAVSDKPKKEKRSHNRVRGATTDVSLAYATQINPELEQWRLLAAEWLATLKGGKAPAMETLKKFLVDYLHGRGLAMDPAVFLRKGYSAPSFYETCLLHRANRRDSKPLQGQLERFIQHVLVNYFSVEDDDGLRVVSPEFQNTIPGMPEDSGGRPYIPRESDKNVLPYRFIRHLREIVCPKDAKQFKDWSWAHSAFADGTHGGDWFAVAQQLIDVSDPDCVWRRRETSKYERDKYGWDDSVCEMWSPVRAVALYIKLELPLRTFQVRMLDSGEADTFRYQSGQWVRNTNALAEGSDRMPLRRGVFRRMSSDFTKEMTGLYISTNKTADRLKDEWSKGYELPWQHEKVLYWLASRPSDLKKNSATQLQICLKYKQRK